VAANLFNRVLTFAYGNFDQKVPPLTDSKLQNDDRKILDAIQKTLKEAKELYSAYRVRDVSRVILELARQGNQYFQEHEPWKLIKEDREKVGNIIHICIRLIEAVSILYYPIIPESASLMFEALDKKRKIQEIDLSALSDIADASDRPIEKPAPLFKKVEDKEIEARIKSLEERMKSVSEAEMPKTEDSLIDIADFKKCVLKVGKVLEAEKVPKSTKLIKMKVKIGAEIRQIVGGLAPSYTPETLLGKKVAVVSNLKPAVLMGLKSEGMLLAAKMGDKLELLTINGDIEDGATIS